MLACHQLTDDLPDLNGEEKTLKNSPIFTFCVVFTLVVLAFGLGSSTNESGEPQTYTAYGVVKNVAIQSHDSVLGGAFAHSVATINTDDGKTLALTFGTTEPQSRLWPGQHIKVVYSIHDGQWMGDNELSYGKCMYGQTLYRLNSVEELNR